MAQDEMKSIQCSFATESALHMAYMPFLKNGGLFLKTNQTFLLGETLTLGITLPNEPESFTVVGKVAWITPKGSQGGKPAGIGVQFIDDNSRQFCNKIEMLLSGMLRSAQITDTM